ncbi:MAG TPA: hypothetical protein ENN09_00460 [Planctomycetes bacterium]|nr:hypothetical protein [Planctomycetota bacterium]
MKSPVEQMRAVVEAAERSGIDANAYHFLMRALNHTLLMVGERRHVTGRELIDGFKDLLRKECGHAAPWLLERWGIREALDVGRIVFDLIELGLLARRPEDSMDDFREGLDPATDFPDSDDAEIHWEFLPIYSGGEMQ